MPILEGRRAKAERGLDDVLSSLKPLMDHIIRLEKQVDDVVQEGMNAPNNWSAKRIKELTQIKKEVVALPPRSRQA